MKQFIVLTGVLPILMMFMLQFSLEERNSRLAALIQDITYAAKEEAKQEGRFTDEIQKRLRERLSRVTGIPPEEIEIQCDKETKLRYASGEGKIIRYKVAVPIKNLMAGSSLLGIPDEANMYVYEIDSYTASERIR